MIDQEEAANQEETAVQAEVVNRMETGKDPREAIRHLIKTENLEKAVQRPRAVRKLAEAGITLSRRTVAKYREEMGIGMHPGGSAWYLTENIDRKTEGKLCHCNL